MPTAYLVKFEQGAGAGAGSFNEGKIVVGSTFPVSTSTGMYAVANDFSGNLFVADVTQNAIYKISESGQIFLFAGSPGHDGFTNGTGTAARFNNPKGIICDRSGNVYVADTNNNRVRKIDMNGRVTTIAGGFNAPGDVAMAPNGDVIVADTGNHAIYRVTASGKTTLVAGSSGNAGNVAGDTGGTKIKGTAARFSSPASVTVDNTGRIYVADTGNYQIKIIHNDGWVKVFSGTGVAGNKNGKPAVAQFTNLLRIKADRSGTLFVIDAVPTYERIKLIKQDGFVSTFAHPPKNETYWGLCVTPADKVFAVVGAGTHGTLDSSSSSSSVSSVSSANSQSSQSSASSQTSSSSLNSKSSQSSQSSATSGNSSSSSSNSSSKSPGTRPLV